MTSDYGKPLAQDKRSRTTHRGLILMIAVALALPLLAACSKEGTGRPPMGPVPVRVATVVRKSVPVTLKAIGSVEAYGTVKVRPRVGGELASVRFKEGERVRQGDLLFVIDPRPFQVALQAAEADSARDSARAASAELQQRRYAELVQKDYVTKDQYDEVKSNAEALRATVEADAADCRSARLSLSFCSIRAPISGRTGNLLVHQGNLVTANDPNPLVVIQQIVPVYISFSVPERSLPEVRRYREAGELRVEASVSRDSSRIYEGELTLIDNAVDETTGTVLLKATFPNEDESLWPGQFMDVSLVLTVRRDAIIVPTEAVQKGQQGDFVYIVTSDLTAEMRPVKVGSRLNDEVVIDVGVAEGDRVVTDGHLRLVPKAKVEIKDGSRPDPATIP